MQSILGITCDMPTSRQAVISSGERPSTTVRVDGVATLIQAIAKAIAAGLCDDADRSALRVVVGVDPVDALAGCTGDAIEAELKRRFESRFMLVEVHDRALLAALGAGCRRRGSSRVVMALLRPGRSQLALTPTFNTVTVPDVPEFLPDRPYFAPVFGDRELMGVLADEGVFPPEGNADPMAGWASGCGPIMDASTGRYPKQGLRLDPARFDERAESVEQIRAVAGDGFVERVMIRLAAKVMGLFVADGAEAVFLIDGPRLRMPRTEVEALFTNAGVDCRSHDKAMSDAVRDGVQAMLYWWRPAS